MPDGLLTTSRSGVFINDRHLDLLADTVRNDDFAVIPGMRRWNPHLVALFQRREPLCSVLR